MTTEFCFKRYVAVPFSMFLVCISVFCNFISKYWWYLMVWWLKHTKLDESWFHVHVHSAIKTSLLQSPWVDSPPLTGEGSSFWKHFLFFCCFMGARPKIRKSALCSHPYWITSASNSHHRSCSWNRKPVHNKSQRPCGEKVDPPFNNYHQVCIIF